MHCGVDDKSGDVGEVVEIAVVVEDRTALADTDGSDQAVKGPTDGLALAACLPVQRRSGTKVIERAQCKMSKA